MKECLPQILTKYKTSQFALESKKRLKEETFSKYC